MPQYFSIFFIKNKACEMKEMTTVFYSLKKRLKKIFHYQHWKKRFYHIDEINQ